MWVKNCDDLDLADDVRADLDHMIDQLYEDMDKGTHISNKMKLILG